MSALDQAFIKAYGKPTATPRAPEPPASGAVAVAAAPRRAAAPPTAPPVAAIERLYHEGTLYRVDQPSQVRAPSRLPATSTAPTPHPTVPPPTSPRRGMRRSMLKLLAGQPAIPTAPVEPGSPPRVQRKVIIRHVSHRAPPPVGLIPPPHFSQIATPAARLRADLAPESADDRPTEPLFPSLPKPSLPAAPTPAESSPLNEFETLAPASVVQGHWQGNAAAFDNVVVLPEHGDLSHCAPQALVSVQLDSLPEPADPAENLDLESLPASATSFAAKSLDDDRETSFRIDAAHGRSAPRPHVRFGTAGATAPSAETPAATTPATELPRTPEPDIAEQAELALEAAVEELNQAAAATAAPPVWEVDQFQWPRVCDRLLADGEGYFSQAGAKLLAAMNDGLKTLAVTGTRRGEGRTTLALCLARVAAKAGIQVAVIDADFARPQIASRLGLEITHGWQDAALGHIPLSEAAIKSLADDVTVLPLEITAVRRSLSLADPRVTATLRAAAATFDLVIVDLGPIAPGEALSFPPDEGCPLDAVIVVRDLRFATALESANLGERLYETGIEAVGIAENFVTNEEVRS